MSLLLVSTSSLKAMDIVCVGADCYGMNQIIFSSNTVISVAGVGFTTDGTTITSAAGLGGAQTEPAFKLFDSTAGTILDLVKSTASAQTTKNIEISVDTASLQSQINGLGGSSEPGFSLFVSTGGSILTQLNSTAALTTTRENNLDASTAALSNLIKATASQETSDYLTLSGSTNTLLTLVKSSAAKETTDFNTLSTSTNDALVLLKATASATTTKLGEIATSTGGILSGANFAAFVSTGQSQITAAGGFTAFQSTGQTAINNGVGFAQFLSTGQTSIENGSGFKQFLSTGQAQVSAAGGFTAFKSTGEAQISAAGGFTLFKGTGQPMIDAAGGFTLFNSTGGNILSVLKTTAAAISTSINTGTMTFNNSTGRTQNDVGFQFLGSTLMPVDLATMTVTFSTRAYIQIIVYIASQSITNTATLQFNADANFNYAANRSTGNINGASVFVSSKQAVGIAILPQPLTSTATARVFLDVAGNSLTLQKGGTYRASLNLDAGNAPTFIEGSWTWNNTAAAINSVTLRSIPAGAWFTKGSYISVYGQDY